MINYISLNISHYFIVLSHLINLLPVAVTYSMRKLSLVANYDYSYELLCHVLEKSDKGIENEK